jgi:hypothetical protein
VLLSQAFALLTPSLFANLKKFDCLLPSGILHSCFNLFWHVKLSIAPAIEASVGFAEIPVPRMQIVEKISAGDPAQHCATVWNRLGKFPAEVLATPFQAS